MSANVHLRSILKAFSWRITGTCVTIIIGFIVTGSLTMALTIGTGELIVKIILYYFHELAWARLPFQMKSSKCVARTKKQCKPVFIQRGSRILGACKLGKN